MKFIADFHIHSHYSLATSKNLTPEYLDYWAQLKGIDVIGTGDCTHPGWLAELKEKLEPSDNGLYCLKKEYKIKESEHYLPYKTEKKVYFMPTGEISTIYKKNNKTRKIHSVCVLPDFDAVQKLQNRLSKIGNITSDGRPILGIDAKDILDITLGISEKAFIIPAHIWTPWFSVLGDKSGFDSLEECYEDLTKYIFAVETGLSSDPPMNWACSFLDKFSLVSNSDAHSPEKLGREANIFNTEISYSHIYNALKNGKGFEGTIEFFPQEGKYHYDGHRKCNICWDPVQTKKHNGICPVCNKPVTKGVMYRVAELADRKSILEAKNRKDFFSITSLPSLVSEIIGCKPSSKKAIQSYFNVLEKVGSDFYTLLSADINEIRETCGELLAEGIRRMRNSEVHLHEGYDGEFGVINVFNNKEVENFKQAVFLPGFKESFDNKKIIENSIRFDIEAFKKIKSSEKEPAAEAVVKEAVQNDKDTIENLEQIKAIEHKSGPCMVIAGPGAGKTYILTERIVRLVKKEKVPQKNILAITFSNKAAEEMRTRVQAKIPKSEVFISTFHALGLSILKEYCGYFGRDKNFLIIDNDSNNQKNKELKKKIRQISDYKQGISKDTDIQRMADEYDFHLKNKNAFDLDDLIYLPVKLLQENSEILVKFQILYKYILIDEYQDINPKQYELIRLLCKGDKPNLFVIGDPDQAIYGFRGSDVYFINKLKQDYSSVKIIELSKSYRCPSSVLKMGGQILDKKRYIKGRLSDIKIDIARCETDKSEADMIAGQIEKMIGGVRSFSMHTGLTDGREYKDISSFSDFAILCRTSYMFDFITNALRKHGIPCAVVSTENFFKKEPFNSILNEFKDTLIEYGNNEYLNKMIKECKNVSEILEYMVKKIDADESDKKKFIASGLNFQNNYYEFLNSIALHKDIDDFDLKQEAVSVMTLHASKGLEFKTVFIPACEQGIIPFELFGRKSKEEVEEEKRLFYVGITRTQKYLFLTYAGRRFFKGRILTQGKSNFLANIEQSLLNQRMRKFDKKNMQLELFKI